MSGSTPFGAHPEAYAPRPAVPLPMLGLGIAWIWVVIAGLTSWVTSWLGSYDTVWIMRVVAYTMSALLVTAVPLLLSPIPWPYRKRAIGFFIPAAIVGVVLSLGAGGIYQIIAAISLVLYAIGWMRLRGRPAVSLFAAPMALIIYGLALYLGAWPATRFIEELPLLDSGMRSALENMVWVALLEVLPVVVAVLLGGIAKPVDPAAQALRRATYEASFQNGPPGVSRGTNGLAIASMVLGLVGGSVLAVVFGHVARSQIRRTREDGDGLAVAGLVLGYIGLVVSLIAVLFIVISSMR